MYVKRNVHAHNNFTVQYLHFLSLMNVSWASKTIIGSKLASFERAIYILLIYRVLQRLWQRMCNDGVHKNSPFQCKTSTIAMQLWSFCTPNGVHLTCNCVSVSAMLVYTCQKNIAQAFIIERYFFVSICPAAIPGTCLSVFLAAVLPLCW